MVADIHCTLRGFDFLNNYGLFIDFQRSSIPQYRVQCKLKSFNFVVNNKTADFIKGFINIYFNIISPQTTQTRIYARVYHKTYTGYYDPSSDKPRCLSEEKTRAVKKKFSELQNNGIIRLLIVKMWFKSQIKISDAVVITTPSRTLIQLLIN